MSHISSAFALVSIMLRASTLWCSLLYAAMMHTYAIDFAKVTCTQTDIARLTMDYTILIHQAEEGGFWSEVPALPGCYSQGETIDETLRNSKEAIELHLQLKMT
ncbi:MAG: type II toxin-antitoxin system HicB family antitoxin [Methanothrix sp.]|nr:type II toxin-antitoxin system HicB family antitoxin [Methanothrix sp.]